MMHRILQEERPYDIPVDAAYGVLFGVLGATFLLTVAGLIMNVAMKKKDSGLAAILRPTDDFLSARNRYAWPTLALSFFASGMGAWVIYGSPEMGAIRTTSWWGVLGYSSASAAGGWTLMWLGPIVKRKVGEDQGFSAVDFALKRYGRLMQLLVMGVSTFYMFIYVVAELTTIANVYATFVGKSTVGTDSEHYTTKISSIVVIFTWAYTALAGLPASILTDKFQGVTISIFVIMLLIVGGSVAFNADAQVYVIGPIERMMALVEKLSENPLGATHLDLTYDDDKKVRDQGYETVLLEQTLERVGELLQVGFGAAGAEIIGGCCGTTPETIGAMRRRLMAGC